MLVVVTLMLLPFLAPNDAMQQHLVQIEWPLPDMHFPQKDTEIRWKVEEIPKGMQVAIFIDGTNMKNSTELEGSFRPGSLSLGLHEIAGELVSSSNVARTSKASGILFHLDEQPIEKTWTDAKPMGEMRSSLSEEQNVHVDALKALREHPPSYPEGKYEGKGIVICAGGRDLFANSYIVIKTLRYLGCQLPIEVFYQGPDEMTAEAAELIAQQEAMIVDTNWFPELQDKYLRGWQIKAAAIFHSSFEQVLAIDADNIPADNPEQWFESEEYQQTGNLYWRDFSTDPHWIKPEFFAMFGVTMEANEPELEAGQVLMNKRKCWTALNIYAYINENWQFFYRNMYGDKDTHRLAYKIAGQPYSVVKYHPESIGRMVDGGGKSLRFCGDTMLHLGPNGNPAFLHRTLSDFEVKDDGSLKRAHSKPMLTWQNVTRGYVGWDVRTIPVWMEEAQMFIEQWCVLSPLDVKMQPAPRRIATLEQQTLEWATILESTSVLLDLPDDAKGRG